MKKLVSSVLAALMIMMVSVVPFTAFSADTDSDNSGILLDDDFSDAEKTALHLNNDEGSYTVADGVLTRQMKFTNQYGIIFDSRNDGSIEITVDFMVSTLEQGVIVGIGTMAANEAKNVLAPLYMHNQNGGYTMSAGRYANEQGPIPAPETNVWYTCTSILDLTNKSMTTVVKNRESGEVLGSDSNVNMEAVDGYWHGWSRDDNISYNLFLTVGGVSGYNTIDNVKISKLNPNILIEDDFSNSAITALHLNNGEGSYTVADGVLTRGMKWTNQFGIVFDAQTGGKIKLTLDFKLSALGEGVIAGIGTASANVGENVIAPLCMHNVSGGASTMSAGRWRGGKGPIPAPDVDVWYTCTSIVDFTNHGITTVVTNRDTGALLGIDKYENMQNESSVWSGWSRDDISYNLFLTVGEVSGYNTIDNIKISKLNTNILIEDDFSNSAITALHLNNGEGSYTVADGVLTRQMKFTNQYGIIFDSRNDGSIEITVDFMVSTLEQGVIVGIGTMAANEAKNVLAPLYMHNQNGGYTMSAGRYANEQGPIPAPETNVWYTCTSILDLTNKSMTTVVKNRESGEVLGSDSNVNMEAVDGYWHGWSRDDNISYNLFLTVGGVSGYNTIDNLTIIHTYNAPEVSEDGIIIRNAEGEIESEWTAINPVTGSITIDFKTPMKEESLTSDTLYLADEAGVKIEGTISYADGAATITFAEGTNLGSRQTYSVNIDGGVCNINGETLGEDKEYSIVTDKARISVAFSAATQEGNMITVPLTYRNTYDMDKTPKIIIAYYDDNKMLMCDATDEYVLTKNTLNGSLTFTYTKNTTVNAESVRVFVFENMDSLIPVSEALDI